MEKIILNILEKLEELELLLSEINNRCQMELYKDNFQAIIINTELPDRNKTAAVDNQ